jgi:hypothetical protein
MTSPTTSNPCHLVTVWNPAYGTDVMESHMMLLKYVGVGCEGELVKRAKVRGD